MKYIFVYFSVGGSHRRAIFQKFQVIFFFFNLSMRLFEVPDLVSLSSGHEAQGTDESCATMACNTETVSCHLLLQMARMEMEGNLKTLAQQGSI